MAATTTQTQMVAHTTILEVVTPATIVANEQMPQPSPVSECSDENRLRSGVDGSRLVGILQC